MRVLFVVDRLNIGGAELHTMKLASELCARGHEVMTVVLLDGGSIGFPTDGFPSPPHLLKGSWVGSPRMLWKLVAVVAEARPDTVIAVNQSALAAATFARMLGAPVTKLISVFHTTVITSHLGRLRLRFFKWCTARADALIFVSKRQRDYWLARRMRSREMLAIQNGIDVRRFTTPSAAVREQARKCYGFTDGDIVLVLVGRLAPEKNHGWLLRVLHGMRVDAVPESERFRAVFVGEGPLRTDLEAQVLALGLSRQVLFAGAHRNVAELLPMGDVGLLVSHSIETFSIAALELMASGLPMIMTDTGGAAEILVDAAEPREIGGLLIPVGDEKELRGALLQMVDPRVRERLGKAARERVVSRFRVEGMVDQYEQFLAQGNHQESAS